MRYLFFALILFLLSLQAVFYWGGNYIFDSSYIIRRYKLEKLLSKVNPSTIINIGDSATMTAIIPDKVDKSWINLSLNGGSFYEDYIMVERLLKTKHIPKTVYLSHHYKLIINTENCFRDITLATNILDWNELSNILEQPLLRSYYSPTNFVKGIQLSPYVELILSKLYLLPEQSNFLKSSLYNSQYESNAKTLHHLEENKGQVYAGDLKEFPMEQVGSQTENIFKVPEVSKYFLDKLLSKLSALGIRTIFIHPPYTFYYKALFAQGNILQNEKQFFERYEAKYPLFRYNSDIIYLPNDHFRDLGHTSEKGALAYSEWLKQSIAGKK
jgi:hypothetical protein